jgi:phage/plasmid primase-like uncharacterized protein
MPNIKFDPNEVQREFLAAMQERHLAPAGELEPDGRLHDCVATNKDGNRGRGKGWYVLYLDGLPAGAFGNRTDGLGKTKWRYSGGGQRLSSEERARLYRETRERQARAHKQRAEERALAGLRAREIWNAADKVKYNNPRSNPDQIHPYLFARNIRARGGIREVRTRKRHYLVVPMWSPHGRIVNVQRIYPRGDKFFLKNARAAGCFFYLKAAEKDNGTIICVCEGYATGVSIFEATGHETYMAFYADNLTAVARMVREDNFDARIVICGDDDWKTAERLGFNPGIVAAEKAAGAVNGYVALPTFGFDRKDEETDFNNLAQRPDGKDAIRRAINENARAPTAATAPDTASEDNGGKKEENEAGEDDDELADVFEELVVLDPLEYERRRKQKADELGIRVSVLDREVEARRKQAAEKTETASAPSIKELAKAARDIINCEDVLDAFLRASDPGIAGEDTIRKMLYLIATTRLFDKPMSAALKGPASVGKSHTRDYVLRFFPPEDVIQFTSLSEKALYYFPGEFSHKILSLGEAGNPEERTFQDLIVRQLMSEGVLRHLMTAKQPDGSYETMTIEKQGPVCFLVTTTRTTLHEENETRMLSLEADDSARQTRRVLKKIARTEGLNRSNAPLDLEDWIAFQRWLAAGETKVFVPFAEVLQELIEDHYSLRLRRDFNQLLDAIKAHALLHREYRERSTKGSIIATIDEDYAAIQPLMADLMATAAEMKVRGAVLDVVDKLKQMVTENPVFAREPDAGITIRQLTRRLRLDRSSTYRRLTQALEMGLVKNLEGRQGRPARYLPTNERPRVAKLLPSVEDLKDAHAENRLSKDENRLSKKKKPAE